MTRMVTARAATAALTALVAVGFAPTAVAGIIVTEGYVSHGGGHRQADPKDTDPTEAVGTPTQTLDSASAPVAAVAPEEADEPTAGDDAQTEETELLEDLDITPTPDAGWRCVDGGEGLEVCNPIGQEGLDPVDAEATSPSLDDQYPSEQGFEAGDEPFVEPLDAQGCGAGESPDLAWALAGAMALWIARRRREASA